MAMYLQGSYEILLYLTDPMAMPRNRPEYVIQLINQGPWDAVTGLNKIKHAMGIAP